MQSIVVNLSIIRFNRNLESSSAYGLLNWMTLPTRLSAEPKLRPGGSSRGRYKSRLARNTHLINYMHDERLLTLEDTVEFFNLILGTNLGLQEKQDLVAFLRAL